MVIMKVGPLLVLVGALLISQGAGANMMKIFGKSMDQIEEKLSARKDLTPKQVLRIMNSAKEHRLETLMDYHNIEDFKRLLLRDSRMCTMEHFRKIIKMHHENRGSKGVPLYMKVNMGRFCRQQFNELFEFCLNGHDKLLEDVKELFRQDHNKVTDDSLPVLTKLEKTILNGLALYEIEAKIGEEDLIDPNWVDVFLNEAIDDSKPLINGHTIKDFKALASRDPSQCTMAELKRRIEMYHGKNANKIHYFYDIINLIRYGRSQFNRLVEYCLRESDDKNFVRVVRELYERSRSNYERETVGQLSSMEKTIMNNY